MNNLRESLGLWDWKSAYFPLYEMLESENGAGL